MAIVMGAICPHPPLIIPEVGKGEENKIAQTKAALEEVGRQIIASEAQRIVWISPHGPVFGDGIAFNGLEEITGNMGRFKAPQVQFELKNDLGAARAIIEAANRCQINTILLDRPTAVVHRVSVALDHGIMAPLWHLQQVGVNLPVVVIYMGILPYEDLYGFGLALQEALDDLGGKTAVIASSDLSHRLTPEAPAGYHPDGAVFDAAMQKHLAALQIEELFALDPKIIANAGECGFRPITMLLGALEGCRVEGGVLAYEAPFGVGYLTAAYQVAGIDLKRIFYPALELKRELRNQLRQKNESFLASLARRTILQYLVNKNPLDWTSLDIPPQFQKSAGVFVSLKKNGQLRGCIGTVLSQTPNIVAEVIQNAISAATRDNRFYPVRISEVPELAISVDVLGETENIDDITELDPQRYGVIVRNGYKSGLLLPNLEGVETAEEQVKIACRKAGIEAGENIALERFEVIRYN